MNRQKSIRTNRKAFCEVFIFIEVYTYTHWIFPPTHNENLNRTRRESLYYTRFIVSINVVVFGTCEMLFLRHVSMTSRWRKNRRRCSNAAIHYHTQTQTVSVVVLLAITGIQ